MQNTAQLKYVTEDDLCGIGMTKPEMRRLKKYFQRHFPQNYLSKFKKMLLPRKEEQLQGSLAMLPEERQERPPVRVPNKHMIPADAIIVNKELGEFVHVRFYASSKIVFIFIHSLSISLL